MTLVDPFNRNITGLRMAVTARCNLHCLYCHHEGDVGSNCEMSSEMACNIVKAGYELGMNALKITGGEPLLRRDLEEIVGLVPEKMDVSLTTNGISLSERARSLKLAGLDRVNVSLDSLKDDRYCQITGARTGDLKRVLNGIDSAIEFDLCPVKINMVLLKENQMEVPSMIEMAREKGVVLQLIELLDFEGNKHGGDLLALESDFAKRADRITTREMHRRNKYFIDGAEVEVVRPMDNTEFCAHCTRLRVTCDGKLKPCLLRSDNLVPLESIDLAYIKDRIVEAVNRRSPYFCDTTRLGKLDSKVVRGCRI